MGSAAACVGVALALLVAAGSPAGAVGPSPADRPSPSPARPASVDGSDRPAAREPAASRARREAQSILAEPRFSPPDLPRPLAGPLEAIGDAVLAALAWLARRLPGGVTTVWAVLGGTVLLIAFAIASRLARRRAPAVRARGRTAERGGHAAEDPGALEREADRAERSGQLARALRARFRAGLLRLDAAERIALRPSLTTGEVSRRLRSPEFDALAATFEEVAYGGREPGRADVKAQRAGWRRLLDGGGPG